MKSVVGVFDSRLEARKAIDGLRNAGFSDKQISFLTPDQPSERVPQLPTTESEEPGVGEAIGGVVGGALGAAGGISLGAAAASLLLPGVGPILASGLLAGAVLGAGGAVGGVAVGKALEEAMSEGIPKDEIFVYEDALRKRRTILAVFAEDDAQAEEARRILDESGAEGIDSARESWWLGLRDAEEARYSANGGDFSNDETTYRQGFEAALHPYNRNKPFDKALVYLRECYGDICTERAFRLGFDRGQEYHSEFEDKRKSQTNRPR